ncbi:MAG: sialidase family protein [Acidimicrobiales bacterium]
MTPRRSAVFLALVLVVAGASAVLTSRSEGEPRLRRSGVNVPLDMRAFDRLAQGVRNSPVLVRNPGNPRNLVAANRVDEPEFACDLHVSADGGATWERAVLPIPPAVPGRKAQCFSPDVAFGADGRLHVAFSSFATISGAGTVPDALWVATSGDGGNTFELPVKVSGPKVFEARLAADPTRAGVLYLAWVQATDLGSFGFTTPGNPIMVARSDDGGATWNEAVRASAPARERVVAPVPAVGRDGGLHLAYLDVGSDSLDYSGAHEGVAGPAHAGPWALVVARSADGSKWDDVVVDPALVPAARFLVLFPPSPSLVVDHGSDRVYVAFHDARGGDADVLVWSSGDRGRSWSTGRRVNDTRPGDGTDQYLPGLATASDGRLDVVYYDRRDDPRNVMNEVSLQSSVDGGRSFTARVRLSDRPFDSRIGASPDRGLQVAELGHRLAVVAGDGGALAAWADTRAGSPAVGRQDLASALVSIRRSRQWAPARLAGGIALLVAGLAVGAEAMRSRHAPTPIDS